MMRVLAVLIGLRALTDVFKPLIAGQRLVFLGVFLDGWRQAVVAPLLGIFMLVYAYGLWSARPFALGMGVAYAVFATVNLIAFGVINGPPAGFGWGGYALFAAIGLAVSWGAVLLLVRQRSAARS
jgi:hypothetical protein